jgi:predicted 2-oxoglutarate/Fe(II)-dependent dioxygenase YbiX
MSSADAVFETVERVHLIRILAEDACTRLVARAEAAGAWDDSPGYANPADGREARISCSLLERDRPEIFADVRPDVERRFARFIGADASPRFVLSRFELIRYEPGGMFALHQDALTSDARRRFSILAYLNEEFEGGATSFPMIDRALRPSRGQGILFPSAYLHEGEPVMSGRKYVMAAYLGDFTGEPDWF